MHFTQKSIQFLTKKKKGGRRGFFNIWFSFVVDRNGVQHGVCFESPGQAAGLRVISLHSCADTGREEPNDSNWRLPTLKKQLKKFQELNKFGPMTLLFLQKICAQMIFLCC